MTRQFNSRPPPLLSSPKCSRPVAGGGAGGARAPPEIFRLKLNAATEVEFFY